MSNDSRGQISVEFVLLIGLVFVLVLAFVPYIGKNMEQDNVMSAAKLGFLDASNDIAYNGTGNTIKFGNMVFNENGTITLTFYSLTQLSSGNKVYIQNKMLNSIAKTLNTNVNGSKVKGAYYNYNVALINK